MLFRSLATPDEKRKRRCSSPCRHADVNARAARSRSQPIPASLLMRHYLPRRLVRGARSPFYFLCLFRPRFLSIATGAPVVRAANGPTPHNRLATRAAPRFTARSPHTRALCFSSPAAVPADGPRLDFRLGSWALGVVGRRRRLASSRAFLIMRTRRLDDRGGPVLTFVMTAPGTSVRNVYAPIWPLAIVKASGNADPRAPYVRRRWALGSGRTGRIRDLLHSDWRRRATHKWVIAIITAAAAAGIVRLAHVVRVLHRTHNL